MVICKEGNGNILYLEGENGKLIEDNRGKKIPQLHYLTNEENKYLQIGSDSKVHIF
ncbi:hypothetical protein ABID39_000982 [Bartonella japonica]|uniref:Uncharacterized protein n=1 Tax=Bartonella japonica TaxID=357761 RepID=A0ABV2FNZ9_9HYPH